MKLFIFIPCFIFNVFLSTSINYSNNIDEFNFTEAEYFNQIFGIVELNPIEVIWTNSDKKNKKYYSTVIPEDIRLILSSLKDTLIYKESKGDTLAIGDTHLSTPSIGILQIRIACVKDINRIYGTDYHIDDRYSKEKSFEMYYLYLTHGIRLFRQKYGKNPTSIQIVSMWNGGIYGGYKNKQALRYAKST